MKTWLGKLALALLLLAALPAAAQQGCRLPAQIEVAPCPRSEAPRGAAGDFDYYILAMSWSPAFCDGDPGGAGSPTQCRDNSFGWIVHGLWPQYHKTRGIRPPWPQYCAAVQPVPAELLRRHLCTLPDPQLMQCQWAKHGSCGAFADSAGYFAAIEQIRRRFALPLPEPQMSSAALAAAVIAANPGLDRRHFRVVRRQGRIAELRFCLDRRLVATKPCE